MLGELKTIHTLALRCILLLLTPVLHSFSGFLRSVVADLCRTSKSSRIFFKRSNSYSLGNIRGGSIVVQVLERSEEN